MSFQNNIIAIPPKQLNGYGDCLSSIIHLIFKYQGKSNYEIMFLNQGKLKYTPAENVNIAFNTNELLVLPEKDYLDKLNIYCWLGQKIPLQRKEKTKEDPLAETLSFK